MESTNTLMSKEKILDIIVEVWDGTTRLMIRWGGWLLVVLFISIVRGCYEYISKNGKVAKLKMLALFVMSVCSGIVATFVMSKTDFPEWLSVMIVIFVTIGCMRIIDAILNIPAQMYTDLFLKSFWAAIDSLRKGKKP